VKQTIIAVIILIAAEIAGGTNCPATATAGWATYYTVKSCQREGTSGVLTASGRQYNESELVCALPEYPPRGADGKRQWGRRVKITNALTGKSIICRQWDYGPGRKARSRGVIVDLSPAAFEAVGGVKRNGRVKVTVAEE
jgi:rare lipoprotein A (peptidoglycan hydrolase)